MSARTNIVALAAMCLLAPGALAQVPAGASNPVGVWRGTSLCRVRPSPCKDEIVVYRITRLNASDSLSIDARKIVNGQEEEMGVLGCRSATSGAQVTYNVEWRVALHDSRRQPRRRAEVARQHEVSRRQHRSLTLAAQPPQI